jgi:hypothetical protein
MTNDYSLSDVAAVTGNENGWNGNSAWVLIILFAMIFGWGNGGFGGNANGATTADLQRAVDLNSIQEGQATTNAEIQRGIYEINGATKDAAYNNLSEIRDTQAGVQAGFANVISALNTGFANQQTCCCQTQRAIDSVNYNLASESAAIQANDTANTQKILDAIAGNRMADMQNQINALQLQNAVAGVVRYPMASTYTSGNNPFCDCACNGYSNI